MIYIIAYSSLDLTYNSFNTLEFFIFKELLLLKLPIIIYQYKSIKSHMMACTNFFLQHARTYAVFYILFIFLTFSFLTFFPFSFLTLIYV